MEVTAWRNVSGLSSKHVISQKRLGCLTILSKNAKVRDNMGVAWVTILTFKFLDLLYIFGTAMTAKLKLQRVPELSN